MDLVEQAHIFGLSNNHTSEPNISLIRLFSLSFNYTKPRLWFCYDIHTLSIQSATHILFGISWRTGVISSLYPLLNFSGIF